MSHGRKKKYVTNEEFLEALSEFHEEREKDSNSQISNRLGKIFLDMVNGIGSRPNFRGYYYIQDMKDRALLRCFDKLDMFNPVTSSNPFGYFTQVIYNEFLIEMRMVNGEKYKEIIYKRELSKEIGIEDKYSNIDFENRVIETEKKMWGVTGKSRKEYLHEKRTCPYCGAEGKAPGIMTWHFDNCKEKK